MKEKDIGNPPRIKKINIGFPLSDGSSSMARTVRGIPMLFYSRGPLVDSHVFFISFGNLILWDPLDIFQINRS